MAKLHYDYWYSDIRNGEIVRPLEYMKRGCYLFSGEWKKELCVVAIGVRNKSCFEWDNGKFRNRGCICVLGEFVAIYKYRNSLSFNDDEDLESYINDINLGNIKWFKLGDK